MPHRSFSMLCAVSAIFLCAMCLTASEQKGTSEIAGQLQKLDSMILPQNGEAGDAVRRMLYADVKERLDSANMRETRAWRSTKTRDDWEKYSKGRLEALRQSLGKLPSNAEKPRIWITKRLKGDGFLIENIVFESRPGQLVTANLYKPRTPKSMPGIVICHSHHNPKTQGELQDMGMLWARLGCAVLVLDQVGHGERRQHPFASAKSYPKSFRVSRQDYFFRYNSAMHLYLIGNSLMSWMVWDIHRGVDVLLAQPNIDKNKIIIMGAVAGGGDPCAVAAALDHRFAAAVPFNFGGPQPENRFPLPKDAEDRFNYAGSGSWESTRNLHLSARDGFMPWVIVGSLAPRKLIYAHEFAWDRGNDPVWKRFQKIYAWYKQPDYLSSAKGSGSVRGKAPESTHCNNIGAVHRQQIYPALKQWFGINIPTAEVRQRRATSELICMTPKLAKTSKQVHELALEIADGQVANLRKHLKNRSSKERRSELRERWSKLLGGVHPPKTKIVQKKEQREGAITVGRFVLQTQRAIRTPVMILRRADVKQPCPVVVALAQQGRAGFLKNRAKAIAGLLKNGVAVCLPDLRGTGETSPGAGRARRSWITSISATELMLGGTIRGGQCNDLLAVLSFLRSQPGIDRKRIALWGDSFAKANSADRNLAVPRGIDDYPDQAEPMGATVALLTALFDDGISAVCVRGGLASYRSVLESPFIYVPHDEIVPGALTAGDISELAGSLAPLPLRIGPMVDGRNRIMNEVKLRNSFASAIEGYRSAKSRNKIELADESNPTTWLVANLNSKK